MGEKKHRSIYENVERAIDYLYRGLVAVQTTLLGLLVLVVSIQIAMRVFPFLPNLLWTEEIARFLLIWVIFLGSAIGVKEASHFTVSILSETKSKRISVIWDMGVIVSMMILSLIFAVRGFKYAIGLMWDISDIAQISMLWVGIAIPIFGFLSLLFLLERASRIIKKGVR